MNLPHTLLVHDNGKEYRLTLGWDAGGRIVGEFSWRELGEGE